MEYQPNENDTRMKKSCNALCGWILGLAWAVNAVAAPAWEEFNAQLFERAQAENKLVLLDLSAEWCVYCKKMDAVTWEDPKVQQVIDEHYLPARIVDEEQPELAQRFRQYGRPAIVIFNAQREEIQSKRGYLKPQWMQWMLEAVVQEAK